MIERRRLTAAGKVRRCEGFTLIEVVAALAVLSVATIIFLSMFVSSMELAQANRNRKAAADLAQDRLNDLRINAHRYTWPSFDGANADPLPVALDAAQAEGERKIPATMPVDQISNRREKFFYEAFSWEALARLPKPDAAYIEATVLVRWYERGRSQVLALTTCLPRPAAGGSS
ncbi:MAG: Prepilin-type N-terminal cleavage/methylation protein [Candidatus Hydrogenedentes bacterium]|nr:Prepilin-type N-terminal cleavage/methylation protein [Candidatus Hydrogenedentota bacterium]